MKPLKQVSRRQNPMRLKMAEQVLQSQFGDGDVQVRMTYQGVVYLRGGCASVPDRTSETGEQKEALRVVRLVQGMRLSIRQMYRLPRAWRRKDLQTAREKHTPYWCTPRAVMSETGPPKSSASNKLAEIVLHQSSMAQVAKTFTSHASYVGR